MPRSSLSRLLAPALVALSIAFDASAPALALVPSAAEAPSTVSTQTAATMRSDAPGTADMESAARPTLVRSIATEWAAAATQRAKAVKVKPARTARKVTVIATHQSLPSYRGRNHVWIPSLGVNRQVVFFSCSASGVANYVYRWGCAGRNNVYLFGHASSVFKPLHDAYVRHQLRRGMKVIYADGSGRVRSYRVTFWKVVSPTGGAWAYAAQSRPSLTLQTCVGTNSRYRLIVRLVAS